MKEEVSEMEIKIKGTLSYVKVWLDKRMVKISGEKVVNGFVAFKDTIREWSEPEGVPVTEAEKKLIISAVEEKTKDSTFMKIRFE